MSDNHTPTLWWVDEENVTVVSVECPSPDVDAASRRIYRHATHFDSERGAWDALGAQITERVILAGRALAVAEAEVTAAVERASLTHQANLESLQRDWRSLAAIAARNFALYQDRRQEWNRQVNLALSALAPAPIAAPPPTFQRGDVVDVTFTSGFTYRGIVRSVCRGRVFVCTRHNSDWHDPACTAITLVERRGQRKGATLFQWAQEFE